MNIEVLRGILSFGSIIIILILTASLMVKELWFFAALFLPCSSYALCLVSYWSHKL